MVRIPVYDTTTHALLQNQTAAIRELIELVRRLLRPLRPSVLVSNSGEVQMASQKFQRYQLTYTPVDDDVVLLRMTAKVNGVEQPQQEFAVPGPLPELKFPDGATVNLTFVAVDDVGLASVPFDAEFSAVDTKAPAPGGVSVANVGEVTEEV